MAFSSNALSPCYSSMVIPSPSLSFIDIIGVWVKYHLSRDSCMKFVIRGGYTHMRVMFINQKMKAAYETFRGILIQSGSFIGI